MTKSWLQHYQLGQDAEKVAIRLYHWAVDGNERSIAPAEADDRRVAMRPCASLDDALAQVASIAYELEERWTLRLVLVGAADLVASLDQSSAKGTVYVAPLQIVPIVEWDRGGRMEWLVEGVPEHTHAAIERALEEGWRRVEAGP